MAAGQHWTGPLLISDDFSTVVADPGWSAQILSDGQMLLAENGISAEQRAPTDKQKESLREASDQVEVELLNHQLFSIAEQMGETLRSTAVSVNAQCSRCASAREGLGCCLRHQDLVQRAAASSSRAAASASQRSLQELDLSKLSRSDQL